MNQTAPQHLPEPQTIPWETRSPEELIAYIVEHHHSWMRRELPRLEGMAQKVFSVHGAKDPDKLAALVMALSAFRQDMQMHLDEEEEIVFPSIIRRKPDLAEVVAEMREDHVEYVRLIQTVRKLTSDYTLRQGACGTWKALWQGLRELETKLEEHLRLESVLYRKVLATV